MNSQSVIDIIAYYLSEYDTKAFEALGYQSQNKGFSALASVFIKKANYLRRLRDEYDVVTNSHRRGQCNRPPRARIVECAKHMKRFSFDELTQMVHAFIENANAIDIDAESTVTSVLSEAVISEAELEGIINFTDETSTIQLRDTRNRVRIYNAEIIRQLKKLYGGCCQLCGENPSWGFDIDITEAHHIAYFSESKNNNASNIIILCPNHHRLIHKLNPEFCRKEACYLFRDGRRLDVKLNFHLYMEVLVK